VGTNQGACGDGRSPIALTWSVYGAGVSSFVPPGWPGEVLPPGAPDWEQSAQAWLLDQCPPEYRGYQVLRRHPLVLAWLARRHAEASWWAMAVALGGARADLAGVVEIGVVEAAIGAVEKEQVRLVATGRAISLVHESLLGHRHVPRL
jgi:hypothetical protein